MAYTSIWRVRGRLGKSLVYIEDPEKTNNPQFYNNGAAERSRENLNDVIAYGVNQSKTSRFDENTELLHQFVSGINCYPTTARTEMMAVKKKYGKEDGTIAYHGIQSFAPNEASPQLVHEIGLKLAQRLWGEDYQVVVATHLDKEHHLHNHFLVNTVSFRGGRKYHRTKDDYREMRRVSDELCREYGLSVIDQNVLKKRMHYGDYRAAQQGKSYWKQILRDDLDEIIQQSMTERQFFENLQKRGYTVKFIRDGEDISIRPPGKERFMRPARQLGEEYTLEAIRKRILQQEQAKRFLPEPKPRVRQAQLKGTFRKTRKYRGLRALYFHYCYLLGIFPRKRPQNRKRLHFLLREDLLKMEQITKEAQLLGAHHIDTAEQLSLYQSAVEQRMHLLTEQRRELYRQQRTVDVKNDSELAAEVKADIAKKTAELRQLRKELALCNNIVVRSGVIEERIRTIQEEQRKEEKQHEQCRRRSGTNR